MADGTTLGRIYLGCEVDGRQTSAQDLAPRVTEVLTRHGIDGATMWSGLGLYEGSSEPAIVVEIMGQEPHVLDAVAVDLRAELRQQEVPWTLHQAMSGQASS